MAAPRPEFIWLVNGNRETPEEDPSEDITDETKKTHSSVLKLKPHRDLQGAEIKCMINGKLKDALF